MNLGIRLFAQILGVINAIGFGNALVEGDNARAAFCAMSAIGFLGIQLVLTKKSYEEG